ncbi:MAG: stage 0 sporulation family protein [Lachnospiraceae bacterium]|nr:stage 0 sporulation family protein [Lachnospiraceae bacterium]MBO5326466.1 stage 0 sporulation family protein [Lachnospiraceae bacterium]
MIKVISVRFRTGGKIYFFDPLEFEIKKGQHVIVETARGMEYGLVVSDIREVEDDRVVQPLKPVIRVATPADDKQNAENLEKKKEAYDICLEKIRKHELDMKLVDAEYTFDNNKVLFYFTADGRIDFRELVKDLAAVFKTRIELRQIGVRDEIKIMGGIGVCGRVLCCHSYLSEFVPVSIKMAKEQNLSLNPTKISGVCGRLMCCLKNEEETYEELNRKLPNVGDTVSTDDGLKGEVHSVNVLRQRIKVLVEEGDEKELKEYHVDQLTFKKKYVSKDKSDLSDEELAELEKLERQDAEDAKKDGTEDKPQRPHFEKKKHDNHHERNERQNHKNHGAQENNVAENSGKEGERKEHKSHFEPNNGEGNQERNGKHHRNRRNRHHRRDRQEGNNGGNDN